MINQTGPTQPKKNTNLNGQTGQIKNIKLDVTMSQTQNVNLTTYMGNAKRTPDCTDVDATQYKHERIDAVTNKHESEWTDLANKTHIYSNNPTW